MLLPRLLSAVAAGLSVTLLATMGPSPTGAGSLAHAEPVEDGFSAIRRVGVLPADAVVARDPRGRWHTIVSTDAGGETASQTLITLTGRRAPVRHRFDVDLPAGAQLKRVGGSLVAVDGVGGRLGRLAAPWAVDGAGREVGTWFRVVDRDTFVQVVDHRGGPTVYPVLADPWWVVPVVIRVGAHVVGRYVVRRATLEAAKRAAVKLAAKQAAESIEDLLAKPPIGLKTLNRRNFRENLRRRIGWSKESLKPYDAHHALPVKFESVFEQAGLNIHNPVFGHPWCRRKHREYAYAYNEAWQTWLTGKDIEDTKEWRRKIERKRLKLISRPKWNRSHQCKKGDKSTMSRTQFWETAVLAVPSAASMR